MWVLFSFFSKPNVSRDNIYRSETSIVERKILFRKFKKKNLRKNPFPTALNHFPRSQPIPNYNRSKSRIYAKKNAKKSSHPNKSSNPTCLLSDSNVSKPKPRSPIPQPASTYLDPRRIEPPIKKFQNTTIFSIPNRLKLSLSPSQPTSTSNPTSPTSKKLPRPVEINDAPESFSQTCSN